MHPSEFRALQIHRWCCTFHCLTDGDKGFQQFAGHRDYSDVSAVTVLEGWAVSWVLKHRHVYTLKAGGGGHCLVTLHRHRRRTARSQNTEQQGAWLSWNPRYSQGTMLEVQGGTLSQETPKSPHEEAPYALEARCGPQGLSSWGSWPAIKHEDESGNSMQKEDIYKSLIDSQGRKPYLGHSQKPNPVY